MLIITNWKALNINIDNDLTHEVKNGRLEDLFNVEDLGLDKEDLKQLKDGIVPQSVYRQILDALSSGFNDCASDPESYLYTSDFDVDQFTLGFKDSDKADRRGRPDSAGHQARTCEQPVQGLYPWHGSRRDQGRHTGHLRPAEGCPRPGQ